MTFEKLKKRFPKYKLIQALLRGDTVIYNATILGIPLRNTEEGYIENCIICGGSINKNGVLKIEVPENIRNNYPLVFSKTNKEER